MKARPGPPSDLGVQDWLWWRSGVSPERKALKFGSVEWTYKDLQEKVGNLSAHLRHWRIRRGERVALLVQPSETFVALVHAIARVGAVAVPLNHRQSGIELLLQLKDSDPSLVVCDEAIGEKVRDKIGPRLWKLTSELDLASPPRGGEPFRGDFLDPSALHSIVYTSGSSGVPKGVELTVSNFLWNAVSFGLRNGASADDRWLLAMPLFHVGGFTVIFRSVLHGSGIVLHRRFEAAPVSRSLDKDEITLASFVPTMLADVLASRAGEPFPSGLRRIFLGGDRPPESLMAKIKDERLPVVLTYGMTETCSQVALSPVGAGPSGSREGVVAYQQVFPSEVAIKSGRKGASKARPGEVGEIVVRGPTVFRGYWRNRKMSEASFDGPWFRTGDLGFMRPSANGDEFALLGRKDDMIISGGEHIYPVEVESSLRGHRAVRDAVVIGRKDERWGQRVEAVLEIRRDFRLAPPSGSDLDAFLKQRMASYKVPKRYHFWTVLPRTSSGKVLREAVRLRLEGKAPGGAG
ncbi:MAG: AMP-binding protein [Thaumarchaeota archaeon]|nr:AMP-binding protein [Nitrososphaerota archaeon]